MGVITAYWSKNSLAIYRMDAGLTTPLKMASGEVESLKTVRGTFARKILIIGRDHLHHARRRYPPASQSEIKKAVAFEIAEIFPLKEPVFHCRIHETYQTHVLVDVWAWEKADYLEIRKVFPFLYAVPEDLAFSGTTGSIRIFPQGESIHLVAHAGNRFLGAATFPAGGFSAPDLQRFMAGLEPHLAEIKEIVEFGPPSPKPEGLTQQVINRPALEYPAVLACLDEPGVLMSRQFFVLPDLRLWEKSHLLMRACIYLVLGYAAMLYLGMIHYNQEIDAVRIKTAEVGKALQTFDSANTGSRDKDSEGLRKEFNQYARKAVSPLQIMDLLARHLPESTYVTDLLLSEDNIEATLVSANPLDTIKAFGAVKEISKVQMKGTPVKNLQTGAYRFSVVLMIRR
jgi:hypothetical protein